MSDDLSPQRQATENARRVTDPVPHDPSCAYELPVKRAADAAGFDHSQRTTKHVMPGAGPCICRHCAGLPYPSEVELPVKPTVADKILTRLTDFTEHLEAGQVRHDREAGAAYVQVSAGDVATTEELMPGIVMADFDKDHRLVGIEVLCAIADDSMHETRDMYVVRNAQGIVGYFPTLTMARWAEDGCSGTIDPKRATVTAR